MRKVWRCFFCDDVFANRRDAAEHFGMTQGAVVACRIRGHEHDLIRAIRDQEQELARHRADDSDILRAMAGMRSEHAEAVRQAEELGYGRGVRDMKTMAEKQFGAEVLV